MSKRKPIFLKSDYNAYLWLAAFALLGVFAKAPDFTILHYVLNFGLACLVLFAGTVISRRLGESRLRDAVALFALMAMFAILIFPVRSPETPTIGYVLAFVAAYLIVLALLSLWKWFLARAH